jgi:hypothetical protein
VVVAQHNAISQKVNYSNIENYETNYTENIQYHTRNKFNIFTILYKDDIKPYINYVVSKYGYDFIKLFENNPYNERKNKCKICGNSSKHLFCSRKCSGKNVSKYKFLVV